MGISERALNVIDYSTLDVGATTALGLDSASPAMDLTAGTVGGRTVRRALFTIEDQGCRWRPDSTDPTTSEGHELADTDILTLVEANYEELLKVIKFISLTGTCKIKITFFD